MSCKALFIRVLCGALLASGCQTVQTTAPGAVGVERKQQMLVSEQDIVSARQTVRKLAQEQGFSLVDQTKLVTAASEIARNTLDYGGGGEVAVEIVAEAQKRGVRLVWHTILLLNGDNMRRTLPTPPHRHALRLV